MKTFSKALIGIIAVCVLSLFFGFIIMFINNGQKTFYVQYGEKEIRNKADNVILPLNSTSLFYCKNSMGLGVEDYSVKIIFAEKFEFKINNEPNISTAIQDISSSFDFIKDKDCFTLYVDETLTIKKILQAVYSDKTVTAAPDVDLTAKDYFTLIVMSTNNERDIITINFRLGV